MELLDWPDNASGCLLRAMRKAIRPDLEAAVLSSLNNDTNKRGGVKEGEVINDHGIQ